MRKEKKYKMEVNALKKELGKAKKDLEEVRAELADLNILYKKI